VPSLVMGFVMLHYSLLHWMCFESPNT
jgi:hypothetical protein